MHDPDNVFQPFVPAYHGHINSGVLWNRLVQYQAYTMAIIISSDAFNTPDAAFAPDTHQHMLCGQAW